MTRNNPSADEYERRVVDLIGDGSMIASDSLIASAQVWATLAVSQRLADLRRDRVSADMLLEPAATATLKVEHHHHQDVNVADGGMRFGPIMPSGDV